ncbi:tripartite motif-containing protein 10-like isoform X1 [Hemicordylus capensis]|uniref:tripartite motif-containing protein 10-like isoform X1 n=1 Tax=Hemicordylus capensis TaxID=884348 RepID=UPI0023031142|nr:tripartite motif-containing protein 10-like isoform X1 [Hemicordylus capensis]
MQPTNLESQANGEPEMQEAVMWLFCERHQKILNYFCIEDEVAICDVCAGSMPHQTHNVVLLKDAPLEFKIESSLAILRKGRDKFLACEAESERESQDLLKQMKAVREKVIAEFRQLHQFLEEQEKYYLAQMEEMDRKIARRRGGQMATLSKERFILENLIREIEEKQRSPVDELLQHARRTLQGYESLYEYQLALPPELKWRIWECLETHSLLQDAVKQFKDTLDPAL